MNYFEKHIGDYLKDTSHLSLLEHGIYNRLFDVYYTREGPIPDDQAARLIGARSRDEKAALKDVLQEFFELVDGAWVQARCQSEIVRYQDKQAKAKRSAEARWSGSRPPSDGDANAHANASPEHGADGMRTHSEGNAPRARPQTPNPKPQSPDLNTTATTPRLSPAASPPAPGLPGIEEPAEQPKGLADCPHQQLVALYGKHLPQLTQPRIWDGNRVETMRARWKQASKPTAFGDGYASQADGLAFWDRFFEFVANCPPLAEGIDTPGRPHWEPDLPWLMKAENFAKVIEGRYVR